MAECLLERKSHLFSSWHRVTLAWAIKALENSGQLVADQEAKGVCLARVLTVPSSAGLGDVCI